MVLFILMYFKYSVRYSAFSATELNRYRSWPLLNWLFNMNRKCLQICIGHEKRFTTRYREKDVDKNSGQTGTWSGTNIA